MCARAWVCARVRVCVCNARVHMCKAGKISVGLQTDEKRRESLLRYTRRPNVDNVISIQTHHKAKYVEHGSYTVILFTIMQSAKVHNHDNNVCM